MRAPARDDGTAPGIPQRTRRARRGSVARAARSSLSR